MLIAGVGVLYISTSRKMMGEISAARYSPPWGTWWRPHDVSGGDLVGMAYLERVDKFVDTVSDKFPVAEKGAGKIDLYIWGDSYTKNIPDSSFYGLNAYHFGRRSYGKLYFDLDTSKVNILIIELGERFVRPYFWGTEMLGDVMPADKKTAHNNTPFFIAPLKQRNTIAAMPGFSIDSLFNPLINQNLEYNLFTYNFLTGVRNLKAELNYKLFNRASGDVVVSDDGEYLFYKETVQVNGFASGYLPLGDNDISYLISQVNILYDNYKAAGFDEVYLAMIPNTASMMQPKGYNYLVASMQDPNRGYPLHMPVIDVYNHFVKDPHRYFKKGDTHWNSAGIALWIDNVNGILKWWENWALEHKK